MLADYVEAELVTTDGTRLPGRAVGWLPSDAPEAIQFCEAEGLPVPNTPENAPWSGLFVGEGDSSPDSAVGVVMGAQNYAVLAQTFHEVPGNLGFQLGRTPLGSAGALGGGQPARWVIEFTGEGTPPPRVSPPRRSSASSQLIGADTRRLWRERALNLVEELAGERLGSDDPEEQAAGEFAQAAVRALRPYVDREIASDRGKAWRRVIEAAIDFIPKGREGRNLVSALRDLANSYGVGMSG